MITQRVGKSIVGKLEREGDWIGHNKLKHSLATKYRQHFEEVITSLIETGQVEERAPKATTPDTKARNTARPRPGDETGKTGKHSPSLPGKTQPNSRENP